MIFFPCINNYPIYSKPLNNELWVLLLEKAYAKIYKTYQNTIVGFSGDALKDLTGAPSSYIDLKDQLKAWQEMNSAMKKKFVLTVSSKPKKLTDESLTSMHSYGIIELKEIKGENGEIIKFIMLSDPVKNF